MIFILKLLMLMMCFSEVGISPDFYSSTNNLAVRQNLFAASTVGETLPCRDADIDVSTQDSGLLDAYSDPAYIEFFENYVIKRKLVSSLSEKTLGEMAERYTVKTSRLKILLCLQCALESIGKNYTVTELNQMSDGELMAQAVSFYSVFWGGLTKEEKTEIKQAFEKTKLKIKAKNGV